MKKDLRFIITTILCIGFLLAGGIFIGKGFIQKNTYSYKNKYVGGDAYNYIINGTYFTGYVTLGGMFIVCSAIFLNNILSTNIEHEEIEYEDVQHEEA